MPDEAVFPFASQHITPTAEGVTDLPVIRLYPASAKRASVYRSGRDSMTEADGKRTAIAATSSEAVNLPPSLPE